MYDATRLAVLLAERLAPVLPSPLRLIVRGPTLIVAGTEGMGLTVLDLGPHPRGERDFGFGLAELLDQLSDEASEETTEPYTADCRVDGDRLRLWFGRVPAGIPEHRWREVIPELEPIALSDVRAT
jgi:hypothetical protein